VRLSIIAVGEKMPGWVDTGCKEYQKRLQGAFQIKLIELPLARRSKNTEIPKAIREESDALLHAIPAKDKVVALDLRGQHWSTETLSHKMADWRMEGDNLSFLIGGPDGFDDRCLLRAQEKWALSALTLPHPLVRVVLYEQLYRAWSLLNHHPYHR
jgi:23S rRNA (pseudouridine1915-N3)-methyltransferase